MFISSFTQLHNKDVSGAKFKIGQLVSFHHPEYGIGTGEVLAVNRVDENSVEYAVTGIDFLLWEDEIDPA